MEEAKKAITGSGSIECYGERGVWVPDGVTAHEIMVGAAVLEQAYEVDHYTARSMVRRVLEAIRATPYAGRGSIGSVPGA
jgi:hypothetical protein